MTNSQDPMVPATAVTRVLWIETTGPACILLPEGGPHGRFDMQKCRGWNEARQVMSEGPFDALVLEVDSALGAALLEAADWQQPLHQTAVLLVAPDIDRPAALKLLAAGVQDIVSPGEIAPEMMARRVAYAIARKKVEREGRTVYSTDLDTGLPNRSQLLEHLSQLLALRARHPSPMAVLVLRVDGLDALVALHGKESAQIARRKVAVRLRAAVRASDVVASLGNDEFGLLLAKLESPADAQRVAMKLSRSLREPVTLMGSPVSVGAQIGIALYPQDGEEVEPLLRHATEAAMAAQRRRHGAANE